MRSILAGGAFLLLTGFCSCARWQHPVLDSYDLTAHDKSGRLVFTGTISILSLAESHLKGQCTIVRQKDAPVGLFDQNGVCEGSLDGDKVSFDFAPSLDDAGLLLEGQLEHGRMTGVWKLDGFVTSPPLGRFEAVKK